MTTIEQIDAHEILDWRGNPTIEVDVTLAERRVRPGGRPVRRLDRRARGSGTARRRQVRYRGKGVLRAVANVNDMIAPRSSGLMRRPGGLDDVLIELDGTPNKGELGANAILGVSLAAAQRRGRVAACRSSGTSAGPARTRCPSA